MIYYQIGNSVSISSSIQNVVYQTNSEKNNLAQIDYLTNLDTKIITSIFENLDFNDLANCQLNKRLQRISHTYINDFLNFRLPLILQSEGDFVFNSPKIFISDNKWKKTRFELFFKKDEIFYKLKGKNLGDGYRVELIDFNTDQIIKVFEFNKPNVQASYVISESEVALFFANRIAVWNAQTPDSLKFVNILWRNLYFVQEQEIYKTIDSVWQINQVVFFSGENSNQEKFVAYLDNESPTGITLLSRSSKFLYNSSMFFDIGSESLRAFEVQGNKVIEKWHTLIKPFFAAVNNQWVAFLHFNLKSRYDLPRNDWGYPCFEDQYSYRSFLWFEHENFYQSTFGPRKPTLVADLNLFVLNANDGRTVMVNEIFQNRADIIEYHKFRTTEPLENRLEIEEKGINLYFDKRFLLFTRRCQIIIWDIPTGTKNERDTSFFDTFYDGVSKNFFSINLYKITFSKEICENTKSLELSLSKSKSQTEKKAEENNGKAEQNY